MELRQLQCLITCAQTESFSKAAAILYTSQSNVSKTISSLESELGIKLFERKKYGIILTEKGKGIYKYALGMLDFKDRIINYAEQEPEEELRICFQPSSWFASAFCDFYIRHGGDNRRYQITSAPVDEIIRRLNNDLDQLGYAYIENRQLEKLKDIFQANHIGYYTLKKTRNMLYYGKNFEVLTSVGRNSLKLIQGSEDSYSGLSSWKEEISGEMEEIKPKIVITTNSDYIMQEVLRRTNLGNISPEYLSHNEKCISPDMKEIGTEDNNVFFICMFRNDRPLEDFPKQFLNYIRNYINERE